MRTQYWHPSVVLLTLLNVGCALPSWGKSASDQQAFGGLFKRPQVTYAEGTPVEIDEFPDKKITDPAPLKIRYAQWMEETGNLTEAQKHYSDALSFQPKNTEAMLGLARIDFAQGRYDTAEQGYQKILQIDRDNPQAHNGLGMCYSARKDWTSAAEELTRANRVLPEDKTIRYHLAVSLVHTGDLAAAQLQFAECVGEAAGHYNIALILKDEGKLQDAESQLQLALRKNPQFKDAQRWLAEIQKSRGEVSRAFMDDAPEEVRPPVKQVTFQTYEGIGTQEIQPAAHFENGETHIAPSDGHSTSP